tara:strand:+ start:266 stop:1405 length:1140 start_codon:yes stop_codon:yes gene_type:complete
MDVPKLYVSPEAHSFESKHKLDAWLRGVDDATLVRPPASKEEVLLGDDGRTVEGSYRYTINSFDAVCRYLAPGLSALVPNLSGETQRSRRKAEFQSFDDALVVFNTVASVRFEAEVAQSQFVFNEREKIIEGVLGPKTKYLDNSLFFQLVDDTIVSTFGNEVDFYGAYLAGRRMLLRYARKDPLATVGPKHDRTDVIHRGYHFSNSESGDASVRAAPLYVNKEDGSACLGSFSKSKTRMIHAGREFRARLNNLLSAAVAADNDDDAVKRGLTLCQGTSLSLPSTSHVDFDGKVEGLVEIVSKYGTITNSLAQNIVALAVYTGAFPSDDAQYKSIRDSHITQRDEYDVYKSITKVAKTLPIKQRESIEQAAFEYLLDDNR